MEKGGPKNGWIRCESKSHRGRFYLFNKETGETHWLPLKRDDETRGKKRDTPPLRLSSNKASKTPAQDRLKRLQHSLKLQQTTTRTSNTKPKKLMEQENDVEEGSSISPLLSSVSKSPRKATKRSHDACSPSEKPCLVKFPKSSEENGPKILPAPDFSSHVGEDGSSEKLVNKNSQITEKNNSRLTNICSGIVKKIKEICKLPFNVSKQIVNEKSHSAIEESFGLKDATQFKVPNKTKSRHILCTTATKQAIANQIKEEINKPQEDRIVTTTLSKSKFKPLNIPSYPHGSANSRLERLKQTLLSQQVNSTKCGSTASAATEVISSSTDSSLLPKANSVEDTASRTRNNEVEAMDWQPIVKGECKSDATTFTPTLVVRKSDKLLLRADHGDENQTMGDIIDTVNENLLRIAAEKQKCSENSDKKWRKDFYYFVVDTNVFLTDLTFIEDLTKMQLSDTKGSLLYVPYAVLQELDKLKMFSKSKEGVKTLAARAIKYLNAKLSNNSLHVQAQSALEERLHSISVESADDSIINCCLQAKSRIPNLLLLSEDVNLRNKAICNNIMVSTKSDLLSKRYDFSENS